MPQLSLSMDKGQIVSWLKKTGDRIQTGDVLLQVESDKATVEVESVTSGILQIVLGSGDGDVPVGAVIGYALADGEAPVTATAVTSAETNVAPALGPLPVAIAAPPVAGGQAPRRLPSSPAARRRAAELSLDWRQVSGTGRDGRIRERDVLRVAREQADMTAGMTITAASIQYTPVARRMAEEFGLDDDSLARLIPSGRKVERSDVEQALRSIVRTYRSGQRPLGSPTAPDAANAAPPRREPVGRIRKRIAERMAHSARTYAPVTLTTEIDASALVNVREELKTELHVDAMPSYNVLLSKVVARAVNEYPILNASFDGDEIVYWPTVNIGLAVDTQRGLVVPVVRDVASKSVGELTREMAGLLGRAVRGEATAEDLAGGTFTITNLGPQEIDAFTPIINPPQGAVLGVGRLRKRVTVVDDRAAVRTMLVLSLTFDHRLVDGAPAARFLQRLKELLERPYLWLAEWS
jgi:pyruvate dehydrogenase E2 component (dihydrolipoamide acetyltransferase)